jgi:hypothetical protein
MLVGKYDQTEQRINEMRDNVDVFAPFSGNNHEILFHPSRQALDGISVDIHGRAPFAFRRARSSALLPLSHKTAEYAFGYSRYALTQPSVIPQRIERYRRLPLCLQPRGGVVK